MKSIYLRTALTVMTLSLGVGLVTPQTASAQETQAAPAAPINLNTATEDELMSIPGMGERMMDEFLEYRPYSNIMGFRAEIGKYVDEAQLDTWQQYVFVPTDPNTATMEQLTALKGVDEATAQTIINNRDYADWGALETVLLKSHDQATVDALQPYWVFN